MPAGWQGLGRSRGGCLAPPPERLDFRAVYCALLALRGGRCRMCRLFLSACVMAVTVAAASPGAEPADKLQRDLLAMLQDRKAKPEIRSTAIRALGALGWSGRSALDDLVKLIDDPEE